MIKIRIHPNQFQPGGMCYGMKNVVISVNTGKAEDNWIGKRNPVYNNVHDFWRGSENALMIDATGVEISDLMLSEIMKSDFLRVAYGTKLIDFADRGIILVEKDGSALTAAQIAAFTA